MLHINISKQQTQIVLMHEPFSPVIPKLVELLGKFPQYFSQIPQIMPQPTNSVSLPIVSLCSIKEEKETEKNEFILFFNDKIVFSLCYNNWTLDFIKSVIKEITQINGENFKLKQIVVQSKVYAPYERNAMQDLLQHIELQQAICDKDSLQDIGMSLRYHLSYQDKNVLASYQVRTVSIGKGKPTTDAPNALCIFQSFLLQNTKDIQAVQFVDFAEQTRKERIEAFKQ